MPFLVHLHQKRHIYPLGCRRRPLCLLTARPKADVRRNFVASATKFRRKTFSGASVGSDMPPEAQLPKFSYLGNGPISAVFQEFLNFYGRGQEPKKQVLINSRPL